MFIRAYLRASTEEQDATRAKDSLEQFAKDRGKAVASYYVENASGTKLDRPELFRLLDDCKPGDVMLVEAVDRLSRLKADDWTALRSKIAAKGVKVVALDLPTSWQMLNASEADSFTGRMFDAINGMLLDMLAAVARKDYEDRRRRTGQGIARAKAAGKFTGRKEDADRNAAITALLREGKSWSAIRALTGCSRDTLARLAKRLKDAA
ncbi:MAG: recombinase family protein [Proteobacteria bacterium]|nr:recombinase family protein [Pseudomonadota bacterium]